MPTIEIGPNRVVLDNHDVTKLVFGYTLQARAGDTPIVVLELRRGLGEQEVAFFEGFANVRIAQEEPTVLEFLQAIDPHELDRMVVEEGDMDESFAISALTVLKRLAG